jgi:coatomer subunit alpha
MCATFHPEDTLIASCSLDMTVRVWDFFKLKEKCMNKAGSRPGELFGGTEVEVKHILEGHDKGVNWVTFHPSMKILASAADDKTIKLWRLSGNKHWEMDTLKGHTNNVSCVMFHPRMEILLSNSEDRTMRFWDLNRRVQIHQTRKDTDRYWILAVHPTLNYFAAGYDNGMNVFKLERERHASVRIGPNVFYVKNKNFYLYDLKQRSKTVVCPVNTSGKQVLLNQPTQIYYNSFNNASHNFLMHFDVEGGAFAIFEVDRDIKNGDAKLLAEKKGDYCLGAVFISKDRIAVLDTNREVTVGNFDGSNTKKWPIVRKGMTKIDMIFPAYVGKILIQADETLLMYDMSARKVTFELAISDVKRVQWTPQFTHAIIMTKHQILVVNKSLQVLN